MSTCISPTGEYSSHAFKGGVCLDCGAFDEKTQTGSLDLELNIARLRHSLDLARLHLAESTQNEDIRIVRGILARAADDLSTIELSL